MSILIISFLFWKYKDEVKHLYDQSSDKMKNIYDFYKDKNNMGSRKV